MREKNFCQKIPLTPLDYNDGTVIIIMIRSSPWRNKLSQLITQITYVTLEMTLYLTNELGPTCFLFKGENNNKFKLVL